MTKFKTILQVVLITLFCVACCIEEIEAQSSITTVYEVDNYDQVLVDLGDNEYHLELSDTALVVTEEITNTGESPWWVMSEPVTQTNVFWDSNNDFYYYCFEVNGGAVATAVVSRPDKNGKRELKYVTVEFPIGNSVIFKVNEKVNQRPN